MKDIVITFRVEAFKVQRGKKQGIYYTITIPRIDGDTELRGVCLLGEDINITREELEGDE